MPEYPTKPAAKIFPTRAPTPPIDAAAQIRQHAWVPKHVLIDLRDKQFGELTVLRREGTVYGHIATWRCRCSCGEEVVYRGDKLRQGKLKTCRRNGHSWARVLADRRPPAAPPSHLSERVSWKKMRERCSNPNRHNAHVYLGRGIRVCERWSSFAAFLEDMGPKPTPRHTIDRIDNDKGYEPGNCRWATRKEQTRNRRDNIFVEIEGKTELLVEVCEERGVDLSRVYGRLKNGWDIEAALTKAVGSGGRRPKTLRVAKWGFGDEVNRLYRGDGLSIRGVADAIGCSVGQVAYWLDRYDALLADS